MTDLIAFVTALLITVWLLVWVAHLIADFRLAYWQHRLDAAKRERDRLND